MLNYDLEKGSHVIISGKAGFYVQGPFNLYYCKFVDSEEQKTWKFCIDSKNRDGLDALIAESGELFNLGTAESIDEAHTLLEEAEIYYFERLLYYSKRASLYSEASYEEQFNFFKIIKAGFKNSRNENDNEQARGWYDDFLILRQFIALNEDGEPIYSL